MAYRTRASRIIAVRLVLTGSVRREALFRIVEVSGFYDPHLQEGQQHHPSDKYSMSSFPLHLISYPPQR